MLRHLFLSAVFLLTSLSASAQQKFVPYGQGIPGPWPFPWAKECPVKWGSLAGRYVMYDQFEQDEIDLKLSMINRGGLKLIRISRYNRNGAMISDGFTVITEKQKGVRVYLRPLTGNVAPVWASLKLYFDEDFSCEMRSLVPILSLIEHYDNKTTEAQYRLVRRPIEE